MKNRILYKLSCHVETCESEYEKDYYIFAEKKPIDEDLESIQSALGDLKDAQIEIYKCRRCKNQNETFGYADYDFRK